MRDDSAAELSMQMLQPIRSISVSNTGKPSAKGFPFHLASTCGRMAARRPEFAEDRACW